MPLEGVEVEGLRDLNRSFSRISKQTAREMRGELRKVAEPVRSAAARLAANRIRNIGPRWSRMRTGVTQKEVYVVPSQRGRLSRRNPALRRPNLATVLMEKALEPGLAEGTPQVVSRLEELLDRIARENGF